MNLKFLSFFLLLSKVLADVSISKPTKGQTFNVDGDSATVELAWEESNAKPKLDDIESYSFTICTGSNSDIDGIKTLKKLDASDLSDHSYKLKVPANTGESGVYFVQIYATTKNGYTINYSQRFELKGMTGSKKASGSDESNPPDGQTSIDGGDQTSTLDPSDMSKSFSVFYTSQTGETRYAPMQMQPGTTVTATTWTRKYPTSSVSFFSTIKHSANVLSTITPGWSYTMSSAVNYASPAPNPSIQGWYNPSSKLTPPSLSSLSSGSSGSN